MRPRSGSAWTFHATALTVLLSLAFLSAQDRIDPSEVSARTSPYVPPSQYRLRTEARLVDVGVAVRDRRGRAVSGLQKRDFEIRDEGKNREIKAFTIQTFTPPGSSGEESKTPERAGQPAAPVRPRFVGLLFDDLNSNLAELARPGSPGRNRDERRPGESRPAAQWAGWRKDGVGRFAAL